MALAHAPWLVPRRPVRFAPLTATWAGWDLLRAGHAPSKAHKTRLEPSTNRLQPVPGACCCARQGSGGREEAPPAMGAERRPGGAHKARLVVHVEELGCLVGTSRGRPPARRYGSARVGFLSRSGGRSRARSGVGSTGRARLARGLSGTTPGRPATSSSSGRCATSADSDPLGVRVEERVEVGGTDQHDPAGTAGLDVREPAGADPLLDRGQRRASQLGDLTHPQRHARTIGGGHGGNYGPGRMGAQGST
jgi:hypothetical protein